MHSEEKYPVDQHTIDSVLKKLPGSPTQHVLHNLIADKIRIARDGLDTVKPDDLLLAQATIKALRWTQALLTRADHIGQANPSRKPRD